MRAVRYALVLLLAPPCVFLFLTLLVCSFVFAVVLDCIGRLLD